MKNTLIALSILGAIGFTSANYTMKVPIEQAQGGSLPNGSITFTNQPTALPEPSDCVNNPSENPVECQNRLTAWEQFADDKGLSKDWENLNWYNKGLIALPAELYPLSNINIMLYLGSNQLSNIDSLSNLENVKYLELSWNNLSNLNGLRNLTRVDDLRIQHNQLTNVDELAGITSANTILLSYNNLTNVDGLINITRVSSIDLKYNQLSNIDGLRNMEVTYMMEFDDYYGKKLPADSRFCLLSRFVGQKEQLCESP